MGSYTQDINLSTLENAHSALGKENKWMLSPIDLLIMIVYTYFNMELS